MNAPARRPVGTTFLALADASSGAESLIPEILPWLHEAANPYVDWLFGAEVGRGVLAALLGSESSELALRRVTLLRTRTAVVGGFVAVPGAELARCRRVDPLLISRALRSQGVRLPAERLTEAHGLLAPVSDEELYLSKLGIASAFRGRGLGRVALERFLADGREAGFGRFRLDVSEDNVAAVRLYESAGFEVVERRSAAHLRFLSMQKSTPLPGGAALEAASQGGG